MPAPDAHPHAKQILAGFSFVLLVFAVGLVLLGEHLIAGVTFLGLAIVIYFRETVYT